LIDWLIIYCSTSHSRIFHLNGYVLECVHSYSGEVRGVCVCVCVRVCFSNHQGNCYPSTHLSIRMENHSKFLCCLPSCQSDGRKTMLRCVHLLNFINTSMKTYFHIQLSGYCLDFRYSGLSMTELTSPWGWLPRIMMQVI
jgi:hypothetical protein